MRETFEIMQKIGVPTGRLDYPSFASQRGGGRHEKTAIFLLSFGREFYCFIKSLRSRYFIERKYRARRRRKSAIYRESLPFPARTP